jgi:aquaporin Z
VSLGLAVAGRFGWKDLIPYWIAQVLGAVIAAAALCHRQRQARLRSGRLRLNGYGALSPGGYSLQSALLIETILTAGFLIVILGSTSSAVPAGSRRSPSASRSR